MTAFDFSMSGIDKIDAMVAKFTGAPAELRAATILWADTIAPVLTQMLIDEAPVRTGRLRTSIKDQVITVSGGVSLQFHSDVPYVPFVISGTQPHDIYPVNAKALAWHDQSGAQHFAAMVHHPGTKPNPFPQRALEKTRAAIIASYTEAIGKVMK